MLRFDLIDQKSKSQSKYKLTKDQKKQDRQRRNRSWGFIFLGLIAALVAVLWLRPDLLAPYIDVRALTASMRPASENRAESQSVVMAESTIAPLSTATLLPTNTAFPTSTPLQPTLSASVAEPTGISQIAPANASFSKQIGYGGVVLQSNGGSLAVAGPDGATVLDSPGGEEVSLLTSGSLVNTNGRTDNKQWVMVSTDDGVSGWAPATSFVLFGFDDLPVTSDSTAQAPGFSGFNRNLSAASSSGADTAMQPSAIETSTPLPFTSLPSTNQPSAAPPATPAPSLAPTAVTAANASQRTPIRAGALESVLAVVRSSGSALQRTPNGEAIRSLPVGRTVNVLGRNSDGAWLWGQTTDGERGWVNASQVVVFGQEGLPVVNESGVAAGAPASSASGASASRRPAPANPQRLPIAIIATDGDRLNIRGGPGTQYAIIGKALDGERFVVVGRNPSNDWIQIQVPDLSSQALWISASYANIDSAVSNLPQTSQGNSISPASPPSQIAVPTAAPTVVPTAFATSQIPTPIPLLQNASRTTGLAVSNVAAPSATGLTGKLVFQQSLGGAIYIYEPATSALRQLSGGMDPAISRDGQRVAFSRFGGDGGIYLIDSNGANERRIYSDTTVRSPKWSPDASQIVFSRLTGNYSCRNIGFGICLQNNPALSQFGLDKKEERGLTRIDTNGDNFRDIAALNTAYTPDWNENGIVYQAVTSIEITEDKPDGETRAVLKQTIGYQDPDWQPNGGRIIFQARQGSHWEIFSVQPDGGGLQALTKPVTALVDALPSNVSPTWSPDGRHIAYVSNRDAGENAGAWRLWVMDADGSNKRPLPVDVTLEYAFNKEQMVSWGQ